MEMKAASTEKTCFSFYHLEGSLNSVFYEGAEIREGTADSNTSRGITSQ